MQEFITIEKDPSLENSQNYALLREQGLKHIEALASDLWTDYNSHDPGVTLLEVLAYAITDLGYRTGNDVKDLLTAKDLAQNNHADTFHKATQILPCNQVTAIDLREILIDIKGIRNAWINIASTFEKSYFVDFDESALTHTDPPSTTESEVSFLNGLYHIVIEFDRLIIPIDDDVDARLKKERDVMALAMDRLQEYRNFCEDYFAGTRSYKPTNTPVSKVVIKPKAFERIVLWADIEVTPESNKEEVHAAIYFHVEQFLVPHVTFYSLQERLAQKKTVDEIFEGPLLEHGFIDEDELEKIELHECIHTSDLYQIIMDIPGVKGVKSLSIANYLSDDGVKPNSSADIEETGGTFSLKKLKSARAEEWCLELSSVPSECLFYELALDTLSTDLKDPINKTVKFYTGDNNIPVAIDPAKSLDALNQLRQNDRKRRERLGRTSLELIHPDGTYRNLDDYFPVQNELPEVYGTGLSGLGEEVTEERKAQAKQLKAYLLFFEQLLSNYLAQLNNVRHLFSWDDTIDKTYYTQLLSNIKDRDVLYQEEYDSIALAPAGVLDEERLAELIQQDAENPNTFFDRRSRFLNHLIARFNEKMVDYSLILHSLEMDDRTIPDKALFLKEYDQISMNRGKGFNYSAMREAIDTNSAVVLVEPDVWDTLNVTGYQHRVARFLGIPDQSRRFLYSGHDMRIEAVEDVTAIKFRYVLTINESTGLTIVGDLFADDLDALNQFEELIENEGKDNVINNLTTPSSLFSFTIVNADDVTIELGYGQLFTTATERDDALAEKITYFDNVSGFVTDIVQDTTSGDWTYTIEVSTANPPYLVYGVPLVATPTDAQNKLNQFMNLLKNDDLGFSLPSLGSISNNEFYYQITDATSGIVIAKSDSDVFLGSRPDSQIGMEFAEVFFNESIGYKNSDSGLHVVEHILLRPKTTAYSFFKVDVRQYDSIDTVENPPVAYPLDYSGVYRLSNYHDQYFLSSEVELTDPSVDNESGEIVNIIEPYFYTLSENQIKPTVAVDPSGAPKVADTDVPWETFLEELRGADPTLFQLTTIPAYEQDVENQLWIRLIDQGVGCVYGNYLFGSKEIEYLGGTYHLEYYFIMDGSTILGGLVSAFLDEAQVKERALRAFAYFCDNTTCKGVANPYEFKATVVLPAWTERARDYNYREYAEEIIRLEAPAHVALDIKWVNRTQMRDFEICYREWLIHQGEFLYLDRNIQLELDTVEELTLDEIVISDDASEWISTPTNISAAHDKMVSSANCLIEKIDGLINVYQSAYKTVVRNDQFFTNNAASNGTVLAWVSGSQDGSLVTKAELVGGILPAFLGFYTGETVETSTGAVFTGDFAAGDFPVINYALVQADSWSFSVKTYRDSGEVSCTDVTITIIKDIEAEYLVDFNVNCYPHLEVGEIIAKVQDDNGEIFSAELLSFTSSSGTFPSFLHVLESYAEIFSHPDISDPENYRPGDIIVISDPPGSNSIANLSPINDPLAVPSEGNITLELVIKITDITGGITVFTNSADPLNTGAAPGTVKVQILGNAELKSTFFIPDCLDRHVARFNEANTVITPSPILVELFDGHENEGVTLATASLLVDPLSGLSAFVTDQGRVQIVVTNFAEFESYVESLALISEMADGNVYIPIELTVVDTCGFVDTWIHQFCVKPDTEAVVTPTVTTCGGLFTSVTTIATVTDSDKGLSSFNVAQANIDALAGMGITPHLEETGAGKVVNFKVTNSTLFYAAVEADTVFTGTEIVNGTEVNTYSFDIDTVDYYGGISTSTVVIYAPINTPVVVTPAYPDGTSYLAYLYHSVTWDPKAGYLQSTAPQGKTVVSFSDANGIKSITCSCKKCNGTNFPTSGGVFWNAGNLDIAIADKNILGDEIGISSAANKSLTQESPFISPATKGVFASKKKSSTSEPAWKLNKEVTHTKEKFISKFKGAYAYPTSPFIRDVDTCECLTKIGLALDKTNNRIYVSNSSLFSTAGIGTHQFSITVVDNCGISQCKEIKLVIGNDKKAYYENVKNNSYLNALKNGDIIGYPVDPDGSINDARLVLYNPTTDAISTLSSPASVLPPGTRFNTANGTIEVLSTMNTSDGIVYTKGATNAYSTKIDSSVSTNITQKSNTAGYSLFTKSTAPVKTSGIQKKTADWNVASSAGDGANVPLGFAESTLELTSIDSVGAIAFDPGPPVSTWINNSGKLTYGTWKISVLTKDVHGGISVIQYTITIKKNKIIKGVVENTGFTGLKGLNTEIKKSYSSVLKAPENVAISGTVKSGPESTIDNTSKG